MGPFGIDPIDNREEQAIDHQSPFIPSHRD